MSVKAILNDINQDLETKDLNRLIRAMQPMFDNMDVLVSIIPAGCILYRARKCDQVFNLNNNMFVSDISYPPPDGVMMGRINLEKQALFYCAFSPDPVLFEIPDPVEGDDIILSLWQTCQDLTVNHLGQTCSLKKILKINKKFNPPDIRSITLKCHYSEQEQKEKIRNIKDPLEQWVQDAFVHTVKPEKTHEYKLSIAISEIYKKKRQAHLDGSVYPSSQLWPEADNLALQPKSVDQKISFVSALHLKVIKVSEKTISVQIMDVAYKASNGEYLEWSEQECTKSEDSISIKIANNNI